MHYTYTESYVTAVARRKRQGAVLGQVRFGIIGVAVFCALLLSVLLLRTADWSLPSFIAGLITGVCLMGVAALARVWRAWQESAQRSIGALGETSLAYTITDDEISVEHALGTFHTPWGLIERVKRSPESWTFHFAGGQQFDVPGEAFAGEVGPFVVSKLDAEPQRIGRKVK